MQSKTVFAKGYCRQISRTDVHASKYKQVTSVLVMARVKRESEDKKGNESSASVRSSASVARTLQ